MIGRKRAYHAHTLVDILEALAVTARVLKEYHQNFEAADNCVQGYFRNSLSLSLVSFHFTLLLLEDL